MLALLSRLFGVFALKSKKPLFIGLGVLFALVLATPLIIEPVVRSVTIRSRLTLIGKINSVERAKLKETALKKSYDSLLADYARKPTGISVVKPKSPTTIKDCFSKAGAGTMLAGAALWVLLGVAALLSSRAKLPQRIGAFFVCCLVGIAFGIAATLIPGLSPFLVHVVCILAVEIALVSAVGTLIAELDRGA